MPAVTIQLCRAGSAVVYCLQDFEPVFELAVNGVRSLGQLADNWLDVTSLIIQTRPAFVGRAVGPDRRRDTDPEGQLRRIRNATTVRYVTMKIRNLTPTDFIFKGILTE